MLRVVSPGELETCHCVTVNSLVYIPDEDYPRCFECLRPVRQYCKLDNCGRWAYLVWSLMVAHESAEDPSEDLPTAASSAIAPPGDEPSREERPRVLQRWAFIVNAAPNLRVVRQRERWLSLSRAQYVLYLHRRLLLLRRGLRLSLIHI